MKIEQQPLEDRQVKLTVEVDDSALDEAKRRAARKLAKKTRIPGFRPGKAPYHVIVRQIGEPAILEEALEILVNDVYPQAIEEAGIEPYGPGTLENVVSMEPPVLEFVVPLEAEVTLGDYQSMRRPYEPPEITEERVDEMVENLRTRNALIEPVERPAEEGDILNIHLVAKVEEAGEGEEAEGDLIHEESLPVLIKPEDDPNLDEEWPFPGFSRVLIGLNAGESKEFDHTFADDSPYDNLASQTAQLSLTVESIKTRTLPDLDDEFARSFGPFETLDDLRADIRSNLERQTEQEYNEEYDTEILAEVVAASEIQYPPQMLEREIESVINNLKRRLEEQNYDLDIYLKTRNMDMDDLREEVTPTAEARLKNMLTLYEIASKENIELESDDLRQQAEFTMSYLERNLSPRETRRIDRSRLYLNVLNSIAADLLGSRAMSRLRAIFKGEAEMEAQAEAAEGLEPQAETEETSAVMEPAAAEIESQVEEPAAEDEPVDGDILSEEPSETTGQAAEMVEAETENNE